MGGRAVRIKSCRGRGGGARNVTYQNMEGEVDEAVSLTLKYVSDIPPTNRTATPELHDVHISNLNLTADELYMTCEGLPESPITGVIVGPAVSVVGAGNATADCGHCSGTVSGVVSPLPCFLDDDDDDDTAGSGSQD